MRRKAYEKLSFDVESIIVRKNWKDQDLLRRIIELARCIDREEKKQQRIEDTFKKQKVYIIGDSEDDLEMSTDDSLNLSHLTLRVYDEAIHTFDQLANSEEKVLLE